MSRPTQEEFNRDFASPVEFGESDLLLISKQYSEAEALEKIRDTFINDWMNDPKLAPTEVHTFRLGRGRHPDEDAMAYVIDKAPTYYEAWGARVS